MLEHLLKNYEVSLKQSWNTFGAFFAILEQFCSNLNSFDAFWSNFEAFWSIFMHSAKFLDPKPRIFLLVNWSTFLFKTGHFPGFWIFEAFPGIQRNFLIRNLEFSFLLTDHFSLLNWPFSRILRNFRKLNEVHRSK